MNFRWFLRRRRLKSDSGVLGNRRVVGFVRSLRLALPLRRVGQVALAYADTFSHSLAVPCIFSFSFSPLNRSLSRPHSTRSHPFYHYTMSGLKNSPFGKRLRAAHQDTDDDTPRRTRQRVNPAFVLTPPATVLLPIPSLNYSQLTASDTPGPDSPEHPSRAHKEYGDRFVPSRDTGDMRTSYHLMDDTGPSTPSKHRTIPIESDAIKGEFRPSSSFAYLTGP